MRIMQGDSGNIAVKIKANGGYLTPAEVSRVELTCNGLTKRYPDGPVSYDEDLQAWLFPYSQTESFAMEYEEGVEVRVLFKDDASVKGARTKPIDITESRSKEVL